MATPSFLDRRANLTGKVAAVVGGGSGIGAAVSLALAEAGVDVAISDVNAEALEATKRDVEAHGRRCETRVGDATDPRQLAAFYEVAATLDRLDIAVNVVGGGERRDFMDATPAQWDADMQRNFGYVLHSTRHAVTQMRAAGRGGSIVNFTTVEAHRGAATFAVYAAANAALANFTRAVAVELAPERIRVNCVAPDTTPSEGNARSLAPELRARMAAVPEAMGAAMRMYIPMGAPPMPDDLANAVLFLASDLSASVTGTTVHVDGGTFAAGGFVNWPDGVGFMPVPLAPVAERLFPQ